MAIVGFDLEAEQEGMSAVLETKDSLPAAFELEGNFPNPFNPDTVIRFSLPQTEAVRLRVFDSMGRAVAGLVAGTLAAGHYQVFWDGRDDLGRAVASGIYFYRLVSSEGVVLTRKMVLLK